MRYTIMLQLVVVTTLMLVGSAALFAWIENRAPAIETRPENGIQQENAL